MVIYLEEAIKNFEESDEKKNTLTAQIQQLHVDEELKEIKQL